MFTEPFEPEPAQGGRSERLRCTDCVVLFCGVLEPPKPCGARPRSLVLPCASQLRPPVVPLARLLFAPLTAAGLFCESWFCRADIAALFGAVELFDVAERLAVCVLVAMLFVGRPDESPVVVMVRTGVCEAAAPGVVRAITERFCTDAGGVATCALMLAAPNELCRVGVNDVRLLTWAPRSEASVICAAPRLTAWPLTKPLREVAVTARTLCA